MATEEQTAVVKRITDQIEAGWRSLRNAYSPLSKLIQLKQATCGDAMRFNTMAVSIFNTQAGLIRALRAVGEAKQLPSTPPISLIAWADGSPIMSCAAKGDTTLLGTINNEPILDPAQVRFLDNDAAVGAARAAIKADEQAARAEQLGTPAAVFWIIGVAIVMAGAGIIAAFDYFKNAKISEDAATRVRLQNESHERALNARLDCLNKCITAGSSAANCAKACEKFAPDPNWIGKEPGKGSSGWWPFGPFTTGLLLVGLAAGGAYWYKKKNLGRLLQRRADREADYDDGMSGTSLVDSVPVGAFRRHAEWV